MAFIAEISVSPQHTHDLFWNPRYTSRFPVSEFQIEFHPGMVRFPNTKLFTSYGSDFFINLPNPLLMTICGYPYEKFCILAYKFTGFICIILSSLSLRRLLCFPRPSIILSTPGADLPFPAGWKVGPNVCNPEVFPGVLDSGRR